MLFGNFSRSYVLGETSFSLFSAQLRDIGFNIEDDFLLKARTILTALAGIEGILEYKPKKTSVCPLYLLEWISNFVTDRTMRTRRRYAYPDCFFYGTDTRVQVDQSRDESRYLLLLLKSFKISCFHCPHCAGLQDNCSCRQFARGDVL